MCRERLRGKNSNLASSFSIPRFQVLIKLRGVCGGRRHYIVPLLWGGKKISSHLAEDLQAWEGAWAGFPGLEIEPLGGCLADGGRGQMVRTP